MKLKRNDFWALICDDWEYRSKDAKPKRDPMLCGVFASEKEALDCAKDIKDCVLDHYIAKCGVRVEYGRYKKVKTG